MERGGGHGSAATGRDEVAADDSFLRVGALGGTGHAPFLGADGRKNRHGFLMSQFLNARDQLYCLFKAKNITDPTVRPDKYMKSRPIAPGTKHPMRRLLHRGARVVFHHGQPGRRAFCHPSWWARPGVPR